MIARLKRVLFPAASEGIGLLYLGLAMVMGVVGGALAVLIRTHLSSTGEAGLLKPETYLSVVTMHGSIMIFGVVMPALFAGIAALALPRALDRGKLAWHGLLLLSFWLALLAQLVFVASMFLEAGASGAGWTAMPPLSALEAQLWDGQDLWMIAVGLACLAYLFVALVVARSCQAAGASKTLLVHSYRFAAWLGLASFPVMLLALGMLALDRHAGASFFMPAGIVVNDSSLAHAGGMPFLFRAMFLHPGHPSLMILVLPALGVALEIMEANSKTPLFGERSSLLAMGVMCLASLVQWGADLYGASSQPYGLPAPSFLAFFVLAGLLLVGANLGCNLLRCGPRPRLELHFVLAMVVTIACAVLGGLWLAAQAPSERMHGSYFAVGHLHFLFGLLSLLAIFAALHHWFPLVVGRRMDEGLGRLHFWLTFGSFLGVFLLMQFQGSSGLLRRYWQHSQYEFASLGQDLAPIITGLTYLGAGAQALFFLNLVSSVWLGEATKRTETP